MARLHYPKHFIKEAQIARNILHKHQGMGEQSLLHPYLNFKGISLDHWQGLLEKGEDHLSHYRRFYNTAKATRKDRDGLFFPMLSCYRKCVQMLRTITGSDTAYLALWGVSMKGNRIALPGTFDGRFKAIEQFYKKHIELGSKSPLTLFLSLSNINPADELEKLHIARELHARVEGMHHQAELHYAQFSLLRDQLRKEVRTIGRYLMRCCVNSPKAAALWGFTVYESKGKTKEVARERELEPAETVTIANCVLGSVAKNTGTTSVLVWKGSKQKGTPQVIGPQERFPILKGHSTIIVQNTSPSDKAKLHITIRAT